MFEIFKTCGSASFVVIFVALLACVASGAALVAALLRFSWARPLAIAAACLAIVPASVGAAGMLYGRHRTDQALSGGAVDPAMVLRIRAEGYAEAMTCVQLGAAGSSLPMLLAVGALVLAYGRAKPGPA